MTELEMLSDSEQKDALRREFELFWRDEWPKLKQLNAKDEPLSRIIAWRAYVRAKKI